MNEYLLMRKTIYLVLEVYLDEEDSSSVAPRSVLKISFVCFVPLRTRKMNCFGFSWLFMRFFL